MFSPNFDIISNMADPNASGRLALDGSKVVPATAKQRRAIRNDAGRARFRGCLPNNTGERLFDDEDLSTAVVRMALGAIDQIPLTGTFVLGPIAAQTVGLLVSGKRYLITNFVAGDSFLNVGATANATGNIFTATGTTPTTWTNASALQEITTDIAIDATYTQVQAALNATAAITALGGVTVTKPVAGTYRVTFSGAYGAQVAIAGPINANMTPLSVVSVSRVQPGTSTVREVQIIRLIATPYCFAVLADPFPVAASAVSTIQLATTRLPATKRITLDPMPYGGTFLFTLDTVQHEAPYNATEELIASLIGPKYTVIHRANNAWDISGADPTQDITIADIDVSKLLVPIGVTGNMPLNTAGMAEAFAATEKQVLRFTLEVEIQFAGQAPQKVYQETLEVHRDLIDLNSVAPSAMTSFLFAAATSGASAVIYAPAITALTGGPFSLEAVVSTALAVDTIYIIKIGTYPQTWILRAGAADAGDPTGEIAPLDYHATTNNKHWEMSGW